MRSARPRVMAFAMCVAEDVGRDEPPRQLTGVESNVHGRTFPAQEIDHPHVQVVVADRHVPIFRLHHVDADEARVGGVLLECPHEHGKHLNRRKCPQALGYVADGDMATGVGCRSPAREHLFHAAFA